MRRNLVIDFVASHSAGKTTVINGVAEILKNQKRKFNIVESVSRIVKSKIYADTTSFTQCFISLFNWGNVLKSSMKYPITLCTDWAVRSLAYTMTSNEIEDRVVNMHKQWVDLFHSDSLTHHANVFHIYIPISFPIDPDGLRPLDEDYQKKVDDTILYIFDSCKIPFSMVTGTPENRIKAVMDLIDTVTCYSKSTSIS